MNDISDYIENKVITLDSLRLTKCKIININTTKVHKINNILRGGLCTLEYLNPTIYYNNKNDETDLILDSLGYNTIKENDVYISSRVL